MSDYRVFNDNGYERTWEELYEDNVSFQKYTDKLEQENKKYKEVIDKANKLLKEKVKVIPFDEKGEGGGLELTDYDIQDLLDILKEVE